MLFDQNRLVLLSGLQNNKKQKIVSEASRREKAVKYFNGRGSDTYRNAFIIAGRAEGGNLEADMMGTKNLSDPLVKYLIKAGDYMFNARPKTLMNDGMQYYSDLLNEVGKDISRFWAEIKDLGFIKILNGIAKRNKAGNYKESLESEASWDKWDSQFKLAFGYANALIDYRDLAQDMLKPYARKFGRQNSGYEFYKGIANKIFTQGFEVGRFKATDIIDDSYISSVKAEAEKEEGKDLPNRAEVKEDSRTVMLELGRLVKMMKDLKAVGGLKDHWDTYDLDAFPNDLKFIKYESAYPMFFDVEGNPIALKTKPIKVRIRDLAEMGFAEVDKDFRAGLDAESKIALSAVRKSLKKAKAKAGDGNVILATPSGTTGNKLATYNEPENRVTIQAKDVSIKGKKLEGNVELYADMVFRDIIAPNSKKIFSTRRQPTGPASKMQIMVVKKFIKQNYADIANAAKGRLRKKFNRGVVPENFTEKETKSLKYDKKTEALVAAFQVYRGSPVKQDGIVGRQTVTYMFVNPRKPVPITGTPFRDFAVISDADPAKPTFMLQDPNEPTAAVEFKEDDKVVLTKQGMKDIEAAKKELKAREKTKKESKVAQVILRSLDKNILKEDRDIYLTRLAAKKSLSSLLDD